jgi:D-alanine-D-alanine ligase
MSVVIGFTYDLKTDHALPPGAPADALAEFDVEETVDIIAEALASSGHRVVRLGNVRQLWKCLPDLKVDIVFNICEGLGHRNRESEVPMLLDMAGVPYVGSDPLTLSLTLDKVFAKKIFEADGVATPKFFVADSFHGLSKMNGMKYPMIVKPRYEGSSKGISERSIVADREALVAQIDEVARTYRQPAIIEEFVRGGEFTVLVIGNKEPEALAPVQIKIAGNLIAGDFVYTSRRLTNDEIEYICPPKVDAGLEAALKAAAVAAYRAVECRDFGRVDFRVDENGKPFVLEINPLPSLSVEDVFPLIARAHGWTFEQLVLKIVDHALERYGIVKN